MELSFVNKEGVYEALFEASNDFNLHIELDKPSYLGIYQSSVKDSGYSFTNEYKLNDIQKVYDIDFGALIYPKYIKVISGSNVLRAEVTFAQ